MVSPAATDRIFYRDTLAWARESGNTDLVDTLTENGPPPYTSMLDYEPALSYEQEVYPYSHAGNSEGAGQMGENIFVGEYTLLEQLHVFGGFLETFSGLYPQIQDVDFRSQATTLDVPVYLAQGAHEAPGRGGPSRPRSGSTCSRRRASSSSPSTPPGTARCGSSPPSSTT